MKLSVQTAGVTNVYGMEQGMKMIREAGFEAIDLNLDMNMYPGSLSDEIRKYSSTGYFDQPDDVLRADTAYVKKAIEEDGLEVYQAHAPFPSYFGFPGHPDVDEYMERVVRKSIMLCGYMGCERLIMHPIFKGGADILEKEDEHDRNIRFYTSMLPEMRKYGIKVCLENMFVQYRGKIMAAICNDAYEAVDYIDELNGIAGYDAFGFCLDTGHSTLVGYDLLKALRILGRRVCAFHIHDNDGHDDRHMAPYTGVTNWPRFLRGVKEIGYEGALSFETFNAMSSCPKELGMDVLKYISAIGRYFVSQIESGE